MNAPQTLWVVVDKDGVWRTQFRKEEDAKKLSDFCDTEHPDTAPHRVVAYVPQGASVPSSPLPINPLNGERAAFEAAMIKHVGPAPGAFDQMSEHWFDQQSDGRYEDNRIDDAWLGWRLANAAPREPAQGASAPREPTQAMLDAVYKAAIPVCEGHKHRRLTTFTAIECWYAMYDAAPREPVKAEPVDRRDPYLSGRRYGTPDAAQEDKP